MGNFKTVMRRARALALMASLCVVAACGGGKSDITEMDPALSKCAISDSTNSSNDCGQVVIALTDADGDFLAYSVNVTKLSLTRADGVEVDVLPTQTRIDFAQYVNLSEFITAATLPKGKYVRGKISLDYSSADIQVEKDGLPHAAQMLDGSGHALTQTTLDIQLDKVKGLVVAPGIPAMLQLDFNLAASHHIDLSTTPISVTTEPFILASVDPKESRDFRVRGPLISVDMAASSYRIALRPAFNQNGRHGGVDVFTTNDTRFDINGSAFNGSDGLTQLATLSTGSATLALGTFSRDTHKFTAQEVYAGSSVPGGTLDALQGVVTARSGTVLTVRGGTLERATGTFAFRENVSVTIGEQTTVHKPRAHAAGVIADISVGQRVTVLGTLTRDPLDPAANAIVDASAGYVVLRLSEVDGVVLSQTSSQINLDLQHIAGRKIDLFNFAGTGSDSAHDANPDDYEIALPPSFEHLYNNGAPVRVLGYPAAFGGAPADFNAISVADFEQARAGIVVRWGDSGTAAPFSTASNTELVIDLNNMDLGLLHHLIRGGISTDLKSLPASPTLVAAEHFVIGMRTPTGVLMFTSLTAFETEFTARLTASNQVRELGVGGGYNPDSNQFTFSWLAVNVK